MTITPSRSHPFCTFLLRGRFYPRRSSTDRTRQPSDFPWHVARHALAVGTLISAAALVISLAALAMSAAPLAHADGDPHIPNPMAGYCPGGGAGNVFEGYCDGTKYPDGSYWHKIDYGAITFPLVIPGQSQPTQIGLSCVIDPDGGIPQPAPPGGCGGAVK